MSEAEKKKRRLYYKNRQKCIFIQAVIIAVVTVAIIISAIVAKKLNDQYYIGYDERGSIDYDVYLKDNDFYEDPYLNSNQSYVASLIDRIITNFNYEIEMDTDNVNYRYSYSVQSKLEIIDKTSGVALYDPEYELVNVQNKTQNSSNRLTINEIVVINYDEYNDLAKRFLNAYSLTETTSSIVVKLDVDVLSDCNAFTGSSSDTYSSELRIPLTTKTVNIKMTSSVPANESKMIACARGAGSEVFETTAGVLGVIDALLVLLLVAFIYLTRTEDTTYTARVKKILSQYKSYIQKIKNLFETHDYQLIMVDTFDEMLEIRDTIQAPILMYENEDKTCAKFMIPTDSKLLYQYEIKIDGYQEPDPEPQKPDPTPTTIVKPNITNVVRPVVKVVVTPPQIKETPKEEAEIKTIVEDAEIEIDADASGMPEVRATVAESESEDVAEAKISTDAPQIIEVPACTAANTESEDLIEPEVEADGDDAESAVIEDTANTDSDAAEEPEAREEIADKEIAADEAVEVLAEATLEESVSEIEEPAVADEPEAGASENSEAAEDEESAAEAKADEAVEETAVEAMAEIVIEETTVETIEEAAEIQIEEEPIEAEEPAKLQDEAIEEPAPIEEATEEKAEAAVEEAATAAEEEIDPQIDEILASIPCADDDCANENMVDAIDIFWQERAHKTYRYDPNGNSVEEGDVVLVPTRDVANDKDVVREAEVARGNYKIDAATLDRPLKKIIGVIRRKTEKIFTSMINTDDEKNKK